MKLSFIRFPIPVALLLQIQGPLFAQTSVSGIISSNTTWTKSGSPYNLTAKVQVKENVTLAIEPGVVVNGNDQHIEVYGTLSAVGTPSSKIALNSVYIDASQLETYVASLNIQQAILKGGGVLSTPTGFLTSLTLRDCRLEGCYVISLGGTSGTSNTYIERNIFVNSYGISTRIYNNDIVYIRNNVFYQQVGGFAIQNSVSSPSGTQTIPEYQPLIGRLHFTRLDSHSSLRYILPILLSARKHRDVP